jgi:hypothetical protein
MQTIRPIFVVAALSIVLGLGSAEAKKITNICLLNQNKLLHDGSVYKAAATTLGMPLKNASNVSMACGQSGRASLAAAITNAMKLCNAQARAHKDHRPCKLVWHN